MIKVNLCGGPVKLKDFVNVDISNVADITLDLESDLLPFDDDSVDVIVCISAINYFSRNRGQEIIKDVHRVLKSGGMTRFGTQDLQILTQKYIDRDVAFYMQKLKNGKDRFPGQTIADKFNEFFYGFCSGEKCCKYVYDFDALKVLFEAAGFILIQKKKYLESQIPEIKMIDNRPEQMLFLEAIKP